MLLIRLHLKAQYAVLKEECDHIFPLVGSGRFITAPVITEDGEPIEDPIVLLEPNPDNGQAALPQENSNVNNFKPVTGYLSEANALKSLQKYRHFLELSDGERGQQENYPVEAYNTSNRLVFFILLDFALTTESIRAIHESGTEYLSFMAYLHSTHGITDWSKV